MDYATPPALVYHDPAPASAELTAQPSQQAQSSPEQIEAASFEQRRKYHFNQPWFEVVRRDWQEVTAPLVGRPLQILEVGCFEGSSTTWILDHLMDHEASTLTAVDWFQGSAEHVGPQFQLASLEQLFRSNVAQAKNADKLTVRKGPSAEQLVKLRAEGARFNFIYIDGSHTALDVMQDMALAWPMLEEGGWFVLDDYRWGMDGAEYDRPFLAIEAFLRAAAPSIRWFERNGQIWATKLAYGEGLRQH